MKNNNSKNTNSILNYYFKYNDGGNSLQNFYNNFNNINLDDNKTKINEEIMMNEIKNKREKQKNIIKNYSDLTSHTNFSKSNEISSNDKNNNNIFNFKKKANSNKNINNINPEKNGYANKRKIFNPIPDSEKEKNKINLNDILENKDLRTTLMIKNIPNKYTLSSFLEEINEYFKDTYDIFYLPIDYVNKCNLGFAFINFVEPLHIILFYELYRGKKWKKFNSDKKCELLYGKYQGKRELISHFERGKVLFFESEDKRPLILPTPNPLPKINLPYNYLSIFTKLYPNISYEIKDYNNIGDNNSIQKFFSINGNFSSKLN